MKLLHNVFWIVVVIGCTSSGVYVNPSIERTDDSYDSTTGVYINNSLSLEITFDTPIWDVYSDPENAHEELLTTFDINIAEMEEEGGEFALLAVHNSHLIIAFVLIEHGVKNLSPSEYFNLIRNINEEDFLEVKEIYLRKKTIAYSSGIRKDFVDYEGQKRFKDENGSIDMTLRILVFMANNFACQFRIIAPTTLNESRKHEIDGLLKKINFQLSPIKTTNNPSINSSKSKHL